MGFALSSGVTGLQAHQKMLDIAGHNLANINTTAFKSSRIVFSEILAETIKKASQPSTNVGGTNPQQMGSGVSVSGITPNMSQGNLISTGNPLDLAVEGEGYFVVNDGDQNMYSRAGSFAVDANSFLVDPATGYRVQRIGATGESDGFQVAGINDIQVPYDVAIPAQGTSLLKVAGNLSADAVLDTPQAQKIGSNITYTTGGSTLATSTTTIENLDQFTGTVGSGVITISGYLPEGTYFSNPMSVPAGTEMGDLIDAINIELAASASGATAELVNGQIRVTDTETGVSYTDLSLSYADGSSTLETPAYFEVLTAGGDEVKNVNITIYDSLGGKHAFSGAFVRTDTTNEWDFLLSSVSGDVYNIDMDERRISGITFDTNGALNTIPANANFQITWVQDPSTEQTVEVQMGTAGKWDGLTQFSGSSTAVAKEQDGYESGKLTSVSVNNGGVLVGAFSNGMKKDVATLQVALFQNSQGLENVGGGYFISSANSGSAVATQALIGGAGTIHGSSLEKSNADVATEFVNMIQAQSGFQANARTITVANDILRELTNLIR
ncbi:MAG: flagellar hook-basal body complex protein [Sedimentisphaerales bacterium]|nr:flagellar hook-basal body complex protein [Sedimentisphaerales bacterium]